jgi:hypothetical protein
MELGPVAYFFSHKKANNLRAKQKGDKKTGQYSRNRTKHYVLIGIKTQPMGKNLTQMP